VVELVHRAQQAQVAFLDQVEEVEAAPDIALGDADDQAQVALRQPVVRQCAPAVDSSPKMSLRSSSASFRSASGASPQSSQQLCFCRHAHAIFCASSISSSAVKQRVAPDVAQIHAHRVEALPDFLNVGDQLSIGTYFSCSISSSSLVSRSMRGIGALSSSSRLFRHVGKRSSSGVGFAQVDIFVQLAFATAPAARQRRDWLQFVFRSSSSGERGFAIAWFPISGSLNPSSLLHRCESSCGSGH
jgi:hypothetical protein